MNTAQIMHGSTKIELDSYPDGMPLIKNHVSGTLTVTLRPTSVMSLMAGLWYVDALAERGEMIRGLFLPCLPGARQDRLNPDGDVLFTAKSIAREINMRDFYLVYCFDPHSDVMPGLIDRCKITHSHELMADWGFGDHGYSHVIAPDAGAAKRASAVAKVLNVPMVQAWKTRDIATGKITGFGSEPLSDHNDTHLKALIVDDICDGGGTFIGLGAALLEQYVHLQMDLFVSHGIFSKGVNQLLQIFNNVYTTDSTIYPIPYAEKDDHIKIYPTGLVTGALC